MSFSLVRLAVTISLSLALVSCGGSPTASEENSGSAVGDASKFEQYEALKGQERRDRLVHDAGAEGVVSLYTSMPADVADALTKAFTEQTGVKVSLYRASSETVLQRLLQEASADRVGADVLESNALEMAASAKEGLQEPYVGERRDLVGPEGRYPTWTASRYNLFAPSWNTAMVPAGQQPKTWEDLADPKWNGQLAMELSDYDWYLTLYGYWEQQGKPKEEIDRLFDDMARGAKVTKGHTVMGELLSAGQFAVAASNYTYTTQRAADKGAPVAYQPVVEPVFSRPEGLALMKSAKHPAAALLFVDWMLTEGQQILVDMDLTPAITQEGMKNPMAGHEVVPIDVDKLLNGQKEWSERYDALLKKSDQAG